MNFQKHKYFAYFIDLFPTIILNNQIVANIVNIVGIKLVMKKEKIDNKINYDI